MHASDAKENAPEHGALSAAFRLRQFTKNNMYIYKKGNAQARPGKSNKLFNTNKSKLNTALAYNLFI